MGYFRRWRLEACTGEPLFNGSALTQAARLRGARQEHDDAIANLESLEVEQMRHCGD